MKLSVLTEDDDGLDFNQDEADKIYNTPQTAVAALNYDGHYYDLAHIILRSDGTRKEPAGVAVIIKYPVKKERYQLISSGTPLWQAIAIIKKLLPDPIKLLKYVRNAGFEQG